ncbi:MULTISPECIES: hypothetical protein [unclassified Streptomyces]|uniref:hypothetical protein n=1 Tax=unclassified Streptomyces TaxID=2593676 RepID=UPI003813EFD3
MTDSYHPVVYRVTEHGGRWTMTPWLDVEDTAVDWVHGEHNLNGIIAVGRHLLTVQSNTGRLWRIDRSTREVTEVDLGGRTVRNGDGLAWRDGRLYVSRGNLYADDDPGGKPQVAVVEMARDLSRGRYVDGLVPPEGLLHPSAVAIDGEGEGAIDGESGGGAEGRPARLLVVNSQYNRWSAGLPPERLPFSITALPLDRS